MIDVVFLPHPGLDQTMLLDMFNGDVWKPADGYEFKPTNLRDVQDGCVLVVPGAANTVGRVNEIIKSLRWVVIIIVSDETNIFEVNKIEHPNMKLWVQTPRADIEYNARVFGVGYGYAREYAEDNYDNYLRKDLNVFISGQNTHARRRTVFEKIHQYAEKNTEVHINETAGFTQGYSQKRYFSLLASAKVCPCPSGAFSPDSFRVYESLEMGVIPIPDEVSPKIEHNSVGYWEKLFNHPLSILRDEHIAKHIDYSLRKYQQKANRIFAWWQQQKRQYMYDLTEDIRAVSDVVPEKTLKDRLTVIVPVSPWKSHPSTEKFEHALKSLRNQLPECEIIVTFDGVREEQEHLRTAYEDFTKRMLWKINHEYSNVLPIVFDKHTHQVGMAREAFKYTKTSSVIYFEGDCGLPNIAIDWDFILENIENGNANVIRLYRHDGIPTEHEYLMRRDKNIGSELIGTAQWSQQPHIANTNFYRELLDQHFTPEAKAFIEERVYYALANEGRNHKWDIWKVFIYLPEDGIPRSYHLDGREDEPNFLESQVF